MRNFYVDWSGGGASTRQGTKYIAQCGGFGARLVPFQPTASISYVLEFGQNYIRFYSNGARIETSPGVAYQIGSPYNVTDLFPNQASNNPGLKWCQDVTSLILTHPNYPPQILTIISPTNWTLTAISFGTTITPPTGVTLATTLAASAGGWDYLYGVTAVDVNGQESVVTLSNALIAYKSLSDTTNPGTNGINWTASPGAASYNVYKATPIFNVAGFPPGVLVGFIGNTTGINFDDPTPGLAPDFAQTPPITQNPFIGTGVVSYTVTGSGTYTAVPSVTVSGGGGTGATASASLGVTVAAINQHHTGGIGDVITAGNFDPVGTTLSFIDGTAINILTDHFVSTDGAGNYGWNVDTFSIQNPGSITGIGATTPTNPLVPLSCSSIHFNGFGVGFNWNFTWGVTAVSPVQQGATYTSVPSVAFSPGGASATAVLGSASAGNPSVATFFQERLVFGAQPMNVQSFNMSQPGSFFNFNISFPAQADDAISGQIISDDLNAIRSFVNVPSGLITLTSKSAWLLNGSGSYGLASTSPVTPTSIVASQQAFNGASDLRPLKINLDIIYSTYKGGYVRDLTYNFYQNIYSGADITTLSNHLFFGTFIIDWCWAEEPFKTIWAVRQDGIVLSCAYVKEQELIGWAQHDTNGQFLSCCSVTEFGVTGESVDAVYFIVQRFINNVTVQYVERMVDRFFFYGIEDSWSVDCGLQTQAAGLAAFGGATQSPSASLNIGADASVVGNTVTLVDNIYSPFTPAMATFNWLVRANGAIYKIVGYTSASSVTANVVRVAFAGFVNYYNGLPTQPIYYSIWAPVGSVSGLNQLVNQQVVGVADAVAIGPLTVSNSGVVTLPFNATKVTLGLQYTPKLQTLPLDLGEPTVQGKRKKITAVTVRAADTLGINIGTGGLTGTLLTVPMKDFVVGNIGSQSNRVVGTNGDLVNGDGRTIVDQVWQEAGNYYINQPLPYPATILGVMPEVTVGDTPDPGRGK